MKGLPRSMSRGSPQRQEVIKQVIKFNAVAIQLDGATGVGWGSAVIGDMPEGNILILGAVAYAQFSKVAATGVQDTFDGDYGIGSTPASDATITAADVDIVASTPLGAATAGVSPRVRSVGAAQAIVDNTDGSLEINLNLLIDDANISADNQDLAVTGELHLAYIVLGDD